MTSIFYKDFTNMLQDLAALTRFIVMILKLGFRLEAKALAEKLYKSEQWPYDTQSTIALAFERDDTTNKAIVEASLTIYRTGNLDKSWYVEITSCLYQLAVAINRALVLLIFIDGQ